MRIGLISDTHGLLRPEAVRFLRGCERIIHAGDIGDPRILPELEALAPVSAVRGNNDRGAWARRFPETLSLRFGEVRVYVIHDLADLRLDPAASGYGAVVSGHSHAPRCERVGGVLFVNPGSAGPRRFKLPVSVGEIHIRRDRVTARCVELTIEARPARPKRNR